MLLTQQHMILDILTDWQLTLRIGNRSEETIADYGEKLSRFAWWLKEKQGLEVIDAVGVPEIRQFIQYLQTAQDRWAKPSRPLSETSIQDYYRVLRAFFNWCESEEWIESSPFASRKLKEPKARQKVIPSYTLDDVRAILNACKHQDKANTLRDMAIIYLLLDTGIRASELCHLKVCDYERGRIKVLGKGNKERYLPIMYRTEKALRDYLRRREVQDDDPLFLAHTGQALTRTGLYQVVKRRAEQAKLTISGLHRFRHSFAVLWLSDGGPLNVLQSLLGHSSPVMSMRYAQLVSSETAEMHQQHSPLVKLMKAKKK